MKRVLWNLPELPEEDEKILIRKTNYKNYANLIPYIEDVDCIVVKSIQPKFLWDLMGYAADIPIIIANGNIWSQILSVRYSDAKGKKDKRSYFQRSCGLLIKKLHK